MRSVTTSSGKYRTKVTIRNANRSSNSMNESVPAYDTTYATRWAQVVPSSAREFVAAQQVNGMVTAVLRMRSDSLTRDITPDMRIEIGSRVLNIAGIYDESDQRQEVVVLCSEEQ